jgi:predicted NAD/FAD-binding protein
VTLISWVLPLRFYRAAPYLLDDPGHDALTLGDYLDRHHYSRAFIEDHLLPMAAAIWSAPMRTIRDHPAASFVRFCQSLTSSPIASSRCCSISTSCRRSTAACACSRAIDSISSAFTIATMARAVPICAPM